MINVISVPQALTVQFTATVKARRGPCIAVPQGAAVVPHNYLLKLFFLFNVKVEYPCGRFTFIIASSTDRL